jgi:ABC-2 type transport system permease protein
MGPGEFLLFTGFAVTGAVILAAAFSAAESLAFFLGDASAISGSMGEFLLSFSLYPETIFGPELRWLFYTLFPSGFIAFIPLAAIRGLSWGLLPLLVLVALLYAFLAWRLFRAGLRRYESGNQMGSRT